MSLVFGAIAPHGTVEVAGVPAAAVPGAEATHAALDELGRRFSAAAPQVTVVLTPHNVHVAGHFAVVLAGTLSGRLAEFDAPEVELSCPVDLGLAAECVVALHDAGLPVVGASFGANDPEAATAPMDWGVLIPLWYMGGRADPPVPAVVISPARDRPAAEHVRAGKALARVAGASSLRVALVASADHGHAHDPAGPYGFDPAAAEYDAQIVELVRENRLEPLSGLSPDFVGRARADSWWQLLMLHGALGDAWQADFLSYEAPTYFGMLCAAFAPR